MNELLPDNLVTRLAETLLHFCWQGFAIAAVGLFLLNLPFFKRASSRYLVSLSLFLIMAVAPVVTFLSLDSTVYETLTTSVPSQITTIAPQFPVANPASIILDTVIPYSDQLVFIWGLGIWVLTCRLLVAYYRSRKMQLDTEPLPKQLAIRVQQLTTQLRMPNFRNIYLSKHSEEALALGFWKPTILIPVAWAMDLPLSTLEAIIAHELAHIRRHDLWVNLLQRVTEVILFYHPAVWWLSNRVREEREMCCDEIAASSTGKHLDYARALENVARYLSGNTLLLGTSFKGENQMKMLKRVRQILGQSSSSRSMGRVSLSAITLLAAVSLSSLSLMAQDAPPREGDRPAAERGDRPAPPPEGTRGDRPRPPRGDADRPPRREGAGRDGDHRPPGPPPEGRRGREEGRPGRGDARREGPPPRGNTPPGEGREVQLAREIQLLREEVRQLREELHRHGPPPRGPQDGRFGPPPRRDGDLQGPPRGREGDRPFPPRDGFGPPPRGPRDGDRPEHPPRGLRDDDRPAPPRIRDDRPDRPRRPESDN